MILNWRVPVKRPKNGRLLYPWSQMKQGQYIVVPKKIAKSASVSACVYGKRHGVRFMSRTFGTQGRCRITRI